MSSQQSLEKRKLELEVKRLEHPWYIATFSWTTVLGIGTLLALWLSGVLDAKRESLRYETSKLEAQKRELVGTTRQFEAIQQIAGVGGGIEFWENAQSERVYAVRVPRPDRTEALFTEASSVGMTTYSEELARSIVSLGNVESLDIRLDAGTGKRLASIVSELPTLKRLIVSVDPVGVAELIDACLECRHLEYISIQCPRVESEQIVRLKELPDLRYLSLAYVETVNDEVTKGLAKFPSLEEVDLMGTAVSETACRELAKRGLRVRDPAGRLNDNADD